VGLAIAVGMGARPPRLLAFLNRQMHSGTQLPIRMSLLILAALFVLAQEFGFESIFGAFAAGMIVGQASKGEGGKPFRDKLEALTFGWFYPFFFVGTGIKFDMPSLVRDATTMILVLVFVLLFLAVRGLPVLLYRRDIERPLLLPFALSSAVPSLSIIVVISDIGARTGSINADIGTAMVGGALLSVMLFPTIAGTLLTRRIPASGLKPRNVP
jgi:Kef-type K+ transport system membrane component KefB